MAGAAAVEPHAAARRAPVDLSGRQFALLLLAALAVSMAYGVTLPLLPAIVERLLVGDAGAVARHTGWLTGAFTLALLAFSPVWGALSDRVDRRVVIAVGLVGGGVALWGLDRADSLASLYLARVAAGVLSAAVLPAVLACLAETTAAQQRQRRFAWLATATALGFLLGPAVGNALRAMAGVGAATMARTIAMPDSPFVLVALLCIASAAGTAGLPSSSRRAQASVESPRGRESSMRLALLLTAFVVFGITIAEVGITLIARASNVLDARRIPAYFALCSAVMVIVQLWAYPRLQRLLGERRAVVASLAVMGAGLALLAWPAAAWVPVLSFALAAGGIGVLIPALAARVAAAGGTRQGWAMGRQAAAANLGQAVGAAATGVLYVEAAAAPFVVAALMLWGGGAVAALDRGEEGMS